MINSTLAEPFSLRETTVPKWVRRGMTVWAPYVGDKERTYSIRCKVVIPMGSTAVVENKNHKFREIFNLSQLRIQYER